jgi:dTMP kinase
VVRLLGGDGIIPAPLAELLLFEADRVQHVTELVRPALDASKIVLCDRFTDSSLAYQGYGRGLDLNLIRRLNDVATGGLKPAITLLLDVPPEIGLAREGAQRDVTGRESLEFHTRVREGFLELAKAEPDRIIIIDATQRLDDITRVALKAIDALLPGRQ